MTDVLQRPISVENMITTSPLRPCTNPLCYMGYRGNSGQHDVFKRPMSVAEHFPLFSCPAGAAAL